MRIILVFATALFAATVAHAQTVPATTRTPTISGRHQIRVEMRYVEVHPSVAGRKAEETVIQAPTITTTDDVPATMNVTSVVKNAVESVGSPGLGWTCSTTAHHNADATISVTLDVRNQETDAVSELKVERRLASGKMRRVGSMERNGNQVFIEVKAIDLGDDHSDPSLPATH